MKFVSLFIALLIGFGLGAGALWFHQGGTAGQGGGSSEREVLYYQHPHNPTIRSDEPRKDEMGMDYIPIYAGDEGRDDDPDVLRISPVVVQNMGVRTAEVERGALHRQISTVGFVEVDEAAQSHVHLRTEGWIEDLRVRTTGERVTAGEVLFRLYSPALVSAQDELLQTLRRNGNAGPARERLRALGMPADAIRQVEQQGRALNLVPVKAPQDGVVQALNVAEGMFVQPGTEVMSIADLSRIWVIADLFEHQSDAVREGLDAEVHFPFRPGETLVGSVGYIYPTLASPTRTIRARITLDNPDGRLKPGMWTDVHIDGESTEPVLHVPAEAVIRTGRQDRVVTMEEEGRFRVHEVRVGRRAGDRLEILEGLQVGARIVTSGQFLIDSESSVTVSLARLQAAAEADDGSVAAEGRINHVDPEARQVNLDHEPIAELGWPAMTMDFEVAEDVALTDLEPGDPVIIHIREREDEEYVYELTHIERLADPTGETDDAPDHDAHTGHDH